MEPGVQPAGDVDDRAAGVLGEEVADEIVKQQGACRGPGSHGPVGAGGGEVVVEPRDHVDGLRVGQQVRMGLGVLGTGMQGQ